MFLARYFIRFVAVFAMFLLVSCIDGREEYWLNADGSGRADLTYSWPAAVSELQGGTAGVTKMLDDFLRQTPQLKSPDFKVTTENGRMTAHLRASFDSVFDLQSISTDRSIESLASSASGLTGEISLKMKGMHVEFSRTIDPSKALPGSIFMPASQFENRRLTYIAHLPVVATESNASSIQQGGKTLVWDFALVQAIRQPMTIHFKAPVPIPTWIKVSAGIVLLLAVLISFKIFVRLKSRRQHGLACQI